MDYIRLIPKIHADHLLESARYYNYSGADQLYYKADDSVEAEVPVDSIDLDNIRSISSHTEIPLNVLAKVTFPEDIDAIFDAGAYRVIVKPRKNMSKALKARIANADPDRVFLYMEATDMEQCLIRARVAVEEEGFGGIVLLGDSSDLKVVQIADFLQVKVKVPILIYCDMADVNAIAKLMKMTMGYGVILRTEEKLDLLDMKRQLEKEQLPMNTFAAKLGFEDFKLNSDGMIPVVTQDYYTNEVLMVAYMTKESFEKTVETGKMTYFSRSRNELWCKGDTSGHYQYVKSLEIDCDNDTILAKVVQLGAACHTGNYSCFYRNLVSKKFD